MKSLLALPLLLVLLVARADEPSRDPMAWPPALRSAVAAAQAASAASAPGAAETPDSAIRQVVFSNGHGYVVVRGRRYGVGEQLAGARIERITEQAVWLREAGQIKREPLYGGVEKRLPPAAALPAKAASGPKNSKEKP